MAERIAFLDALLAALGWGHKVRRGGSLGVGRGAV